MLKIKEKLLDLIDSIYWNHFESLDNKQKIIRIIFSLIVIAVIFKIIF